MIFSIFSICTLYFVDKVYHKTGLPINVNYTYSDDATIAQLLHESFMLFCRGITSKFPCEVCCAI